MKRRIGAAARLRLAAATGAVAALALAGCSSSSSAARSSMTMPASSATSMPPGPSHATSAPAATSRAPAGGSSSAGPARAATLITIKNFAYRVSGPVTAGATVRVTNDDATEHTVTADSGHGFDVAVSPGNTATFTAPHSAGRYRFHCDFHSDMHGTLTVAK